MKKKLFYTLCAILLSISFLSCYLILITNNNILFYTVLFLLSNILFILLLPFYSKNKNFKHNDINYTKNFSTEFNTIYETLLNKFFDEFNYNIKDLKFNIIFQYLIFFISLILFIVGVTIYKFSGINLSVIIIFYISLISFIIYIIFLVKNNNSKKILTNTYKNTIISNFLHLLNDNLSYPPSESLHYKIIKDNLHDSYKYTEFDDELFDYITITDCIEGILDHGTKFKMCDINVEKIIKFHDSFFVKDVFEGIFVSLNTLKNINSCIKIKNNKLKIFKQSNLIKLDNNAFEKYFDVYSNDKILTMRILTSDTTNYLLDFYNKYNLKFEINIKNNYIYIRFFTNAIFELNIFKDPMNKNLLYSYYIVFQFIKDISQKINSTLKNIEI